MRRFVIRSFRDRLRHEDMRSERGKKVATRVRVKCGRCGRGVGVVEEYKRGLLVNTRGTFSDDPETIECPVHGRIRVTWDEIEAEARRAEQRGKPVTMRR